MKLSKEAEVAQIGLSKEQSGANQPKKITQVWLSPFSLLSFSSLPLSSVQLQQRTAQTAEKAATSDQEYKDALRQTNSKQHDFYITEMPNLLNVCCFPYHIKKTYDLLQEFQQFEEERITFTKTVSKMCYVTLFIIGN